MTDAIVLKELGQIHDTFIDNYPVRHVTTPPDILRISTSSRMHRHGMLDKDAILRWHEVFATEDLSASGVNWQVCRLFTQLLETHSQTFPPTVAFVTR